MQSPLTTEEVRFPELWAALVHELGHLNNTLLKELENCWHDLEHILESQMQALETLTLQNQGQSSVADFQNARTELSRNILAAPLEQWERHRPYKQALKVIESYDGRLKDLAESSPKSIRLDGPQAIEVLSEWQPQPWAQTLARLRRKPFALPFAQLVSKELWRRHRHRAKVEGQYLLTMVLAIRHLRENWDQTRELFDRSFRGGELSTAQLEIIRNRIKQSHQTFTRQAEAALQAWRIWADTTGRHLAQRLLTNIIWRSRITNSLERDWRSAFAAHHIEQFRSVETEIRLEQVLERTEDGILSRAAKVLDSLSLERANLFTELDGFIAWLQAGSSAEASAEMPSPSVDIVPAASRIAEFESSLKSHISALPVTVSILNRFSALPQRHAGKKELKPGETLLNSFRRAGRDALATSLKAVESAHHKVVQHIEQARDVVTFSLESVGDERSPDREVVAEALQNSRALLEFSRNEIPDWRPEVDQQFAHALANVFLEARLMLTRNRVGEFAYLARQGFGRALLISSRSALSTGGRFLSRIQRAVSNLALQFMVYIGWRSAPTAGRAEVVTRPFLPSEYATDLLAKELPAIYRRLFRFEAVQDARFLVGRDKEMQAIGQARAFWEAGRPVALVIIGERGSGKTSLINCALKESLEDLAVIRGEFKERLVSGPQLRGFLAEMFGVKDAGDLERFLSEQRRVVIIEELERAFLRQVGHFGAVRSLQRLIAATCHSTLWILVINQVAYKFLQASVSLGQSFSHRINATSVTRDDLREAVLLRHNLSGLRLRFSPPPERPAFLERWKDKFQSEADPEKIFFDMLAKESAGVFRSAFNIWLSQIEAVESGILYMKPLVPPDLSPVIDDLQLADLFTLVAIMQHGSLTPEEHATVFQKSNAASRAQIDELMAREIIEQDPGRAGYRLRPEALRVVREALYRRNLL